VTPSSRATARDARARAAGCPASRWRSRAPGPRAWLRALRIGWLGDLGGHRAFEPGILELCEAALARCAAAGAPIEPLALGFPLPHDGYLPPLEGDDAVRELRRPATISVPAGFDAAGRLPMDPHLIGPPRADAELLAAAAVYEAPIPDLLAKQPLQP